MTKTASPIQIRPIAGALGAELTGLDLGALDEDGLRQLRIALLEHLVVFVPGQHLSSDAHRALGHRFGALEIHPYIPKLDEDHPEIVVLRSDQGGIADVWHTDVTFSSSPPQMSISGRTSWQRRPGTLQS